MSPHRCHILVKNIVTAAESKVQWLVFHSLFQHQRVKVLTLLYAPGCRLPGRKRRSMHLLANSWEHCITYKAGGEGVHTSRKNSKLWWLSYSKDLLRVLSLFSKKHSYVLPTLKDQRNLHSASRIPSSQGWVKCYTAHGSTRARLCRAQSFWNSPFYCCFNVHTNYLVFFPSSGRKYAEG